MKTLAGVLILAGAVVLFVGAVPGQSEPTGNQQEHARILATMRNPSVMATMMDSIASSRYLTQEMMSRMIRRAESDSVTRNIICGMMVHNRDMYGTMTGMMGGHMMNHGGMMQGMMGSDARPYHTR